MSGAKSEIHQCVIFDIVETHTSYTKIFNTSVTFVTTGGSGQTETEPKKHGIFVHLPLKKQNLAAHVHEP